MIYLFHLITIYFIIVELGWIFNPREKYFTYKNLVKFAKLSKEEIEKEQKYNEYLVQSILKYLSSVLIILWLFIGLFTFNWILFLGFIILQFAIISPLNRLFKNNDEIKIKIHWINSVIGLIFAIFVIVNHFHLKIDFFKMLF